MFRVHSRARLAGRSLTRAASVAALTFLLSWASLILYPAPGLPLSWPVNAVLAGLLLRLRIPLIPLTCLAVCLGLTAAQAALGASWGAAARQGLIDLSGVAAVCALLAAHREPGTLRTPRAIAHCLLACLAGALASSAAAVLLYPASPPEALWAAPPVHGLAGQLLSYCAFLPPILLHPRPRRWRSSGLAPWHAGQGPADLGTRILPLVGLTASLFLSILLGGLGALAFSLSALLYCALSYRQHTTAWLTLASAVVLSLGITQGWIPSPAPGHYAADDQAPLVLQAEMLLLVTVPLFVSSVLARQQDLVSTLNTELDHDQLTRALAREAFLRRSNACLRAAPADGTALLMLDIDHFKALNDQHGHATGDEALRAFAATVSETVRPGDLFGRLGGEEFGITLPDTGPQAARHLAQALQRRIQRLTIQLSDGPALCVTASIGLVHHRGAAKAGMSTLLARADAAMYQAKRLGRNRICTYDVALSTASAAARGPAGPAAPPAAAAAIPDPMNTHMHKSPVPHARLAILEDDPNYAAWLQQTLSSAGFVCDIFSEGTALLSALRAHNPFQLLLLDWELPGINGLETLRWVRANLSEALPVIFVTSRAQESDLVEGLDAGANDYLCKPCRPAELLARIRALLRRPVNAPQPSAFRLAGFAVDMANREIRLRGELIQMTPKEFDLAALFLAHPWRLFSRGDLSLLVWNRDIPATSRTLDTHLSSIRRKLQLGPASGTLLSASYALGYRLELLTSSASPDHDDTTS